MEHVPLLADSNSPRSDSLGDSVATIGGVIAIPILVLWGFEHPLVGALLGITVVGLALVYHNIKANVTRRNRPLNASIRLPGSQTQLDIRLGAQSDR